MNIHILGGGCYGYSQASLLLKAMDRGALERSSLILVDRNEKPPAMERLMDDRVKHVRADWAEYLKDYFEHYNGQNDRLVPAHIAPHLLMQVTAALLSKRTGLECHMDRVSDDFNLPFKKVVDGTLFISAAAWLCPFSCIEPEVCPAIRKERDWDLGVIVPEAMKRDCDTTLLFKTRHFVWGVGSIPCQEIDASLHYGEELLLKKGRGRLAVATTSNCHGAVSVLRFG
ncbi:MAG: hypothetical protein QXP70_05980 [Methanomassiliicoccales archaeon]